MIHPRNGKETTRYQMQTAFCQFFIISAFAVALKNKSLVIAKTNMSDVFFHTLFLRPTSLY